MAHADAPVPIATVDIATRCRPPNGIRSRARAAESAAPTRRRRVPGGRATVRNARSISAPALRYSGAGRAPAAPIDLRGDGTSFRHPPLVRPPPSR